MDKSDVQLALLNWRNTPRNDILGSPNQRLYSRITRSPLPINDNNLKPKIITGVTTELKRLREVQAKYGNRHTKKPDSFEINEKVRHKVAHRQWEGARVLERPEGLPRSVIIQTDQGQILRRNFSHLHKTQADITRNRVVVPDIKYTEEPTTQQVPSPQSPAALESQPTSTSSSPSSSNHMLESTLTQPSTAPRSSRYGRIIKPVNRLDL
ncbi:putative transposase [Danaus plexippus plexippus]|uniref:Transposase n=2 Tax=Danaus plexippus TaxID=13037 RepID=A0A212FHD5_DANPL|nr:putative transposase [Danaus plexippus plexippus]